MKSRAKTFLVGDFETTVYEGQKDTAVWAAAIVPLFTENVEIYHSIADCWAGLRKIAGDIVCYFHNLKFDGAFWLDFLLIQAGYKQAVDDVDDVKQVRFKRQKDMENGTIRYSISDMGAWYTICVRIDGRFIEFRDSLKLLPFSVKEIGKSFSTAHQKLDMEYEGFRFPGCEITPEEREYIANDVLVVKEALEIMVADGHLKLTIGSCCLSEYQKIVGYPFYKKWFPDLTVETLPEVYGAKTMDAYIRKAYRGGWCYVVPEKRNIVYHNGTTADVNSLYPSMMHSMSGNKYPIGMPTFWRGNLIPPAAQASYSFFYVRIRTRFQIKPDKLPFVQIKGNFWYRGTESLKTSDVYDRRTGEMCEWITTPDGERRKAIVELTLTEMDFRLLQEHYELTDFEILDGCYFTAAKGLFDDYIDKYAKIKKESKGAKRTLAKLYLNNLYGKLAAGDDSSFKVAYQKPDRSIGYTIVEAHDKKPGYIPVGAAITSYARCFTIRAAQANYYGPDEPGFIYADTDSCHMDIPRDAVRGMKIHDRDFCCWKLESGWDMGLFVRQKTYIEHVTSEDGELITEPFYDVKCAGMPKHCKELFLKSVEGWKPTEDDPESEYRPEELAFLREKREITDFKLGLTVPGKLLPRTIPGGVLLCATTYEMR